MFRSTTQILFQKGTERTRPYFIFVRTSLLIVCAGCGKQPSLSSFWSLPPSPSSLFMPRAAALSLYRYKTRRTPPTRTFCSSTHRRRAHALRPHFRWRLLCKRTILSTFFVNFSTESTACASFFHRPAQSYRRLVVDNYRRTFNVRSVTQMQPVADSSLATALNTTCVLAEQAVQVSQQNLRAYEYSSPTLFHVSQVTSDAKQIVSLGLQSLQQTFSLPTKLIQLWMRTDRPISYHGYASAAVIERADGQLNTTVNNSTRLTSRSGLVMGALWQEIANYREKASTSASGAS